MGSSSSPGILYQNASSTILLIDIPRSLEAAQLLSPSTSLSSSSPHSPSSRRILSSPPLIHPYPSLEPKSAKARANLGISPPSLKELLLRKHVEFALQEIRDAYEGPWCLERVVEKALNPPMDGVCPSRRKKLKIDEVPNESSSHKDVVGSSQSLDQDQELEVLDPDGLFYTNPNPEAVFIHVHIRGSDHPIRIHIPPHSTFLRGSLLPTLPAFTTFTSSSPSPSTFSLIVLDPPWPNRSARRKATYSLSYNITSIRSLLSSLPLADHLTDHGLVAVWITNKDVFREMVLGPGGMFEMWGVRLVEEWVWVKTTRTGEPICNLDSAWRRPWEVLLVGRRNSVAGAGSGTFTAGEGQGEVKRRIIAGVPDLHSRKPNLKSLFERVMLKETCQDGEMREKKYEALEIFARNLTAGWWSWGDEVLKFQSKEFWVDVDVVDEMLQEQEKEY